MKYLDPMHTNVLWGSIFMWVPFNVCKCGRCMLACVKCGSKGLQHCAITLKHRLVYAATNFKVLYMNITAWVIPGKTHTGCMTVVKHTYDTSHCMFTYSFILPSSHYTLKASNFYSALSYRRRSSYMVLPHPIAKRTAHPLCCCGFWIAFQLVPLCLLVYG